jgi:membrane protein DedA with SNARE-associated domain
MFDWITGLVEKGGYFGIAFLMLIENVFPPVPSELIMPLAGFTAARGELGLPFVVLAGALGSIAGTMLWYLAGRWFGLDRLEGLASRHGRWLTVSPQELDQAHGFFVRHGGKAVFLGRLVPGIRTLISIPAGIVRMSLTRFLIFSMLGTLIWTSLLAGAGFLLETRYEAVSRWLNPVANGVLGMSLLWYVYRVATFRQPAERAD